MIFNHIESDVPEMSASRGGIGRVDGSQQAAKDAGATDCSALTNRLFPVPGHGPRSSTLRTSNLFRISPCPTRGAAITIRRDSRRPADQSSS